MVRRGMRESKSKGCVEEWFVNETMMKGRERRLGQTGIGTGLVSVFLMRYPLLHIRGVGWTTGLCPPKTWRAERVRQRPGLLYSLLVRYCTLTIPSHPIMLNTSNVSHTIESIVSIHFSFIPIRLQWNCLREGRQMKLFYVTVGRLDYVTLKRRRRHSVSGYWVLYIATDWYTERAERNGEERRWDGLLLG